MVYITGEKRKDDERRLAAPVLRHETAHEPNGARCREEPEQKRHHAPAQQSGQQRTRCPDARQNGIYEWQRGPLREEEVAVRHPPRAHHLRGVQVPAFVLVQATMPDGEVCDAQGHPCGQQPGESGDFQYIAYSSHGQKSILPFLTEKGIRNFTRTEVS